MRKFKNKKTKEIVELNEILYRNKIRQLEKNPDWKEMVVL